MNVKLGLKPVDKQGRIVLPKKWRETHLKDNSTVCVSIEDGKIVLEEYKPVTISQYFDTVDIDIEADLEDWPAVKKELYKKKGIQ